MKNTDCSSSFLTQLIHISGVDFTNILRTALMGAYLQSAKNTVKQSVFFALLGSLHIKAVYNKALR